VPGRPVGKVHLRFFDSSLQNDSAGLATGSKLRIVSLDKEAVRDLLGHIFSKVGIVK